MDPQRRDYAHVRACARTHMPGDRRKGVSARRRSVAHLLSIPSRMYARVSPPTRHGARLRASHTSYARTRPTGALINSITLPDGVRARSERTERTETENRGSITREKEKWKDGIEGSIAADKRMYVCGLESLFPCPHTKDDEINTYKVYVEPSKGERSYRNNFFIEDNYTIKRKKISSLNVFRTCCNKLRVIRTYFYDEEHLPGKILFY